MAVQKLSGKLECVLVDMNTQWDFCDDQGAYPVANRRDVVAAYRRLMDWAGANHVAVISSLDSHRRWELNREGVPPHCIDGTAGQRKLDFTLLPNHLMVEGDNTLAVSIDLFDHVDQVLFRKRTHDLLCNPKADRFMTQLPCEEFIVFGNGLENSIKALVLGLICRGRRVSVVLDACGYWVPPESDLAVRQIWAKGATLLTVDQVCNRRMHARPQTGLHEPRNGKAVVSPRVSTIIPVLRTPGRDAAARVRSHRAH